MRPEDLTDAKIEAYNRVYAEMVAKEEFPFVSSFSEGFIACCYLADKLRELNCPSDLVDRICFAAGQRQTLADDPWEAPLNALENYKRGVWEEPGAELSEKLIREEFGDNPDPNAILKRVLEKWSPEEVEAVIEMVRHAKNKEELLKILPKVPPVTRN